MIPRKKIDDLAINLQGLIAKKNRQKFTKDKFNPYYFDQQIKIATEKLEKEIDNYNSQFTFK